MCKPPSLYVKSVQYGATKCELVANVRSLLWGIGWQRYPPPPRSARLVQGTPGGKWTPSTAQAPWKPPEALPPATPRETSWPRVAASGPPNPEPLATGPGPGVRPHTTGHARPDQTPSQTPPPPDRGGQQSVGGQFASYPRTPPLIPRFESPVETHASALGLAVEGGGMDCEGGGDAPRRKSSVLL